MPSFCAPFALAPKAAMMRPFTGQRNDGRLPSASAVLLTLSVVGWVSGVAMRAFCTGTLATFSTATVRGCATFGACGAGVVATRRPCDAGVWLALAET